MIAFLKYFFIATFAFSHSLWASIEPNTHEYLKYRVIQSSDQGIQEAALNVNNFTPQYSTFIVDTDKQTAVQLGATNTAARSSALWIETLTSFALSTAACTPPLSAQSQGVDCTIILPEKLITLTFRTNNELAGNIIVGVFPHNSGILGEAQNIAQNIAHAFTEAIKHQEIPPVPFAIVGLEYHDQTPPVAQVILVDTKQDELFDRSFYSPNTECCDLKRLQQAILKLKISSFFVDFLELLANTTGSSMQILFGLFNRH